MKISEHIADYEIWDKWTREVKISPYIVRLFEAVRNTINYPILITSGYRSVEYQAHLKSIGYPAADISPHSHGAALDMLYPFIIDKDEFVQLFLDKSRRLGYGIPRIGRKKYNDTFLHVDIVYLHFEPYCRIANPKPVLWQEGVNW